MTGRIVRNSIIMIIPATGIAALLADGVTSFSIAAGGILGVLNIRVMIWAVEGLMGAGRVEGPLVMFSIFRLFLLALVIGVLLYRHLVNVPGMVIGFSIIFMVVIREGWIEARRGM